MTETQALFPETYEASRERFRNNLPIIQAIWPQAKLLQHKLAGDEDLTIDWIYSEALESNEKVLLFTTAEHGVEGYVGSAMLQRFIETYMPKLEPKKTGILLVHAINPWGMKHHRRGTAKNVDLNRTFIWNDGFGPAFNPDYDKIHSFLSPSSKIKNIAISNLVYMIGLSWHVAR